jgi:hypothetical protein
MTAGAGRVGVLTGVPRWVHLTHAALIGFLALVLLARLVGLRLNLPGQLALLLVVVAGVLAAGGRSGPGLPTDRAA